ncbi:hypothetical protein LTR62_006473 [Meristemomyces frigidus]|uniref:Uncharacterized protein n=1 Tax=Meristemomyces frigidus TaxID=1508187 RepID=A0AAN7YEG9_9PEZI|nr:hypothetical protein LTR62_006473 [Meristemomyces frigidus]
MAPYHDVAKPRLASQKAEIANRALLNSQQYTNYLPLHPQAKRKTSVSKYGDNANRDRESANPRASTDPVTGRRRATMRSKEHDDEEEQLQRALEESKKEVGDGNGTGRRNGKRGRDNGDDVKTSIKRQRTMSESMKTMPRTETLDDEDSDGDNPTTSRQKKARAEAVQTARQVELRDKEVERERARAEAAGRRQERAGRRRVDGEEDDTPRADTSARTSPPRSSQPPSPAPYPTSDALPQKKFPGKKVKKLGNNQYTKARELSGQLHAASPHSKKRNLVAGHTSSGDERAANGNSHATNTSNSTSKNSPGHQETITRTSGKRSKAKNKHLNGLAANKQPASFDDMTIAEMNQVAENMRRLLQQDLADRAAGRKRLGLDPDSDDPVPLPMMSGAAAVQAPLRTTTTTTTNTNNEVSGPHGEVVDPASMGIVAGAAAFMRNLEAFQRGIGGTV